MRLSSRWVTPVALPVPSIFSLSSILTQSQQSVAKLDFVIGNPPPLDDP